MTDEKGTVEIRERGIKHLLSDILVALNRVRPPATATYTCAAEILHGWYVEHNSRDTLVQSRCGNSLSATLTLADDENATSIPFRLLRHKFDGTKQTEVHATEVIGLAVGGIVVEIVVQQAFFEHTVVIVRLAVQHAVCIEVKAEGTMAKGGIAHTLAHLTTAPVATNACRSTKDNNRQRMLSCIRRFCHIGTNWCRSEAVYLNVLTDVLSMILRRNIERSGLDQQRQGLQLRLLAVPVVHQVCGFLIASLESLRCHDEANALGFTLANHFQTDGTGTVDGCIEKGELLGLG